MLLQPTGVGSEVYWQWLATGFGWLLVIGSAGWLIALVIGTILGIMRTLPNKTARTIGTVYVSVYRNIPLLIQLFFGSMWCQRGWHLGYKNGGFKT